MPMDQQDPRLLRDEHGHFLQFFLWRHPRDPKGGRVRPHWMLLTPVALQGFFIAVVSPVVVGWWGVPVMLGLVALTAFLFHRSLLYPDGPRDVLVLLARACVQAGAALGLLALLVWAAAFR